MKVAGTEGALVGVLVRGHGSHVRADLQRSRVQAGQAVEEIPIPRAAGEVFELEDQFARFVQLHPRRESAGRHAAWMASGRCACASSAESVQRGTPVAID